MKKILSLSFLTAVVMLISANLQAQQANEIKRIKVKGNKFINESGDVMIFRGLNASDPDKLTNDGHWNKEYFTEIKNWGANIVRFPVHPTAWRKRGQEEYIKILDEGVEFAKELGLYVIIDWHSIGNLRDPKCARPGNTITNFKQSGNRKKQPRTG